MLLIPTYIAPSSVHGVGVFAQDFIPKGTCLWEFNPALDQIISKETLASMPAEARAYVEEYGYESEHFPGGLVLNFDNSRFLNHNDFPNTENKSDRAYALRDIQPGEEITCDYRDLHEMYGELDYVKNAA